MTTILDVAAARLRIRAAIHLLTDDEKSTAMQVSNLGLSMEAREEAMKILADSSENGLELLKAFADLCRCFALDSSTPKSATDVN
jgi:hypothetical protein